MSAPSSSSVRAATAAGAVLSRENSPAERRAAALTVARFSTDLDDCRELLTMLGLDEMLPASGPAR